MNYLRVGRILAMAATSVCATVSLAKPELASVLTPFGMVFASFSSTNLVNKKQE